MPLLAQQFFRLPGLAQSIHHFHPLRATMAIAPGDPLAQAEKARLVVVLDLGVQDIEAVMILRVM